jgi:RNA ligase
MNEIMKILLDFGKEHPARTMDFDELVHGLFVEVSDGSINVNYHPEFQHLAIFKYTQDCVVDRKWNKFSLMARGLILDLKNKDVVATPFVKFFNNGEIEQGSVSILDPEFTVTEKVDGSLGIMFYYEEKWRVATAGSFISEQAVWSMDWMHKNIFLDNLDKSNTYLYEIIYAQNKIVVHYDFEGLVLLGIYDSYGLEYPYEQLLVESGSINVRCAKQYDFNDMNSILADAKVLDSNNEGYVILFNNGVRMKVKGDEYVRIHRLISRVTPLAIWESILNGDDLNEVVKELPEEMEQDFLTIAEIIRQKLYKFVDEVEENHMITKDMTDKELGLLMRDHPEFFNGLEYPDSKRYIFLMRKSRFYSSLNDVGSMSRRQVFKAFKPTANVLEGYTPSSVVNRFSQN